MRSARWRPQKPGSCGSPALASNPITKPPSGAAARALPGTHRTARPTAARHQPPAEMRPTLASSPPAVRPSAPAPNAARRPHHSAPDAAVHHYSSSLLICS